MNSALQCISHTPALTHHLLSEYIFMRPFVCVPNRECFSTGGKHQSELNPSNPLGTGGKLAISYASHLKHLFASNTAIAYASRDLKYTISQHAPQFSVYAQQDSQELLGCLLDGLHEDLNRVLQKPYVANPEWQGGGDPEVLKLGEEFWEAYKKRNDSVVVDLFQGQYKSSIVCPECGHVSPH